MDETLDALAGAFVQTGAVFAILAVALAFVSGAYRSRAAGIAAVVSAGMTVGLFLTSIWVYYLAQVV